jgi:hypothetical protein
MTPGYFAQATGSSLGNRLMNLLNWTTFGYLRRTSVERITGFVVLPIRRINNLRFFNSVSGSIPTAHS